MKPPSLSTDPFEFVARVLTAVNLKKLERKGGRGGGGLLNEKKNWSSLALFEESEK